MAEFQEVCKQWRRLCMSFEDKAAKDYRPCAELCPVGCNPVCGELCESTQEDVERFEAAVMLWAEENPEPVYPTWKEWLEKQRVVVHFDSVNEKGTKVKWELTNKSNCSIPADLAQKLGIEPKEG